jgi:hypothetical protein
MGILFCYKIKINNLSNLFDVDKSNYNFKGKKNLSLLMCI